MINECIRLGIYFRLTGELFRVETKKKIEKFDVSFLKEFMHHSAQTNNSSSFLISEINVNDGFTLNFE